MLHDTYVDAFFFKIIWEIRVDDPQLQGNVGESAARVDSGPSHRLHSARIHRQRPGYLWP